MSFTYRQRILKKLYPVFTFFKKLKGQGKILSRNGVLPPVSFYSLPIILNSGRIFDTNALKGKKVLIVNTASNCGFTNQYAELQKLYSDPGIKLEIIGFPSNDFKEQEKASDEEIATFCSVNFGVSFHLLKKVPCS
jgi:Glutathione peroxidase